jgi:hypothetical protein
MLKVGGRLFAFLFRRGRMNERSRSMIEFTRGAAESGLFSLTRLHDMACSHRIGS